MIHFRPSPGLLSAIQGMGKVLSVCGVMTRRAQPRQVPPEVLPASCPTAALVVLGLIRKTRMGA